MAMKIRIVFTSFFILLVTTSLIVGCSKSSSTTSTSNSNLNATTTIINGSMQQKTEDPLKDPLFDSSGALQPSFGPTSFNIGSGSSVFEFASISEASKIAFKFSATGSLVSFSILDPWGNIILIGSGGNDVSSGGGSFIPSSSGVYKLYLKSSGKAIITVNYKVFGNYGQLGD